MPPTIAPASIPVMPSSPPAHGPNTTAVEGGFSAILHDQVPHGPTQGKQAATAKNASSSKRAKASQDAQDPAQAGIAAATIDPQKKTSTQTFAAQRQAAFLAGLGANAADGSSSSFPIFDETAPKLTPRFAMGKGQSGQTTANAKPDVPFLEKLLPRLTESKSVNNQTVSPRTANQAQAPGQEGVLMSKLRQLVESHDSQATVSFTRGGRVSLNDMHTLAVRENGPRTADTAQTVVTKATTPDIETTAETAAESVAATVPAAAKTAQTLATSARLTPILTNKANNNNSQAPRHQTPDKPNFTVGAATTKRGSEQSRSDTQTGGQTPQAPSGGQTMASDDPPALSQAIAAAAATTASTAADSAARPGQLPTAGGMAVMQQVIDHIRDLARPLTNRISLQLHPPELGELKINLTMKEGMIRASVVTQTMQAQEILEKNMPKLRGLLAEQGLVLDDVRIDQDGVPLTNPAFFDNGQSPRRENANDANGQGTAAHGEGDEISFAQALEQAGQANESNRQALNIHA